MSTGPLEECDLMLTLHPHGWSVFQMWARDSEYRSAISHVFNDPYFELIDSLIKIIKGDSEVGLVWYGEPGGVKIEFKRIKDQKHIVVFSGSSFVESYGEDIKDYNEVFSLKLKERTLLIIFYTQLKKTSLLLRDKEYRKNRDTEFPHDLFYRFEKLMIEAKYI